MAFLAIGANRPTPSQAVALAAEPKPAITLQPEAKTENPKVAAGLVRWHASFGEAKIASEKSGKPVLLFHMMGQLDRQFC